MISQFFKPLLNWAHERLAQSDVRKHAIAYGKIPCFITEAFVGNDDCLYYRAIVQGEGEHDFPATDIEIFSE